MKTKTLLTTFITALLLSACGGGGGNQQATASTTETATVETIEIAPIIPAIIDIAGNLENRKEFRLSDFGSSVQYIRLQPPAGIELRSIRNTFISSEELIIVNDWYGLFVFSANGEYLRTLVSNKWEDAGIPAPGGGVGFRQTDGILNNVDFLNGTLFYRTRQWASMDAGITDVQLNIIDIESLPENAPPTFQRELPFNIIGTENLSENIQPTFQRELDPGRDGRGTWMLIDDNSFLAIVNNAVGVPALTARLIHCGDTLFTINNYRQPNITGGIMTSSTSTFYRFDGNVMMQIAHNDTVFALIPPNRLEPAFIMNWGEFKPDMNRLANGATEEDKFVLQRWVETQRHIFIEYTEGRIFPARWEENNIPRHLAVFDKETKTLSHHTAPTLPVIPIPLMFENDIDPVGMPFFPQGVNHRGEMFMVFGKLQVQQQIATGKFDNSRLQALYNRMEEGSFYLMVVR